MAAFPSLLMLAVDFVISAGIVVHDGVPDVLSDLISSLDRFDVNTFLSHHRADVRAYGVFLLKHGDPHHWSDYMCELSHRHGITEKECHLDWDASRYYKVLPGLERQCADALYHNNTTWISAHIHQDWFPEWIWEHVLVLAVSDKINGPFNFTPRWGRRHYKREEISEKFERLYKLTQLGISIPLHPEYRLTRWAYCWMRDHGLVDKVWPGRTVELQVMEEVTKDMDFWTEIAKY